MKNNIYIIKRCILKLIEKLLRKNKFVISFYICKLLKYINLECYKSFVIKKKKRKFFFYLEVFKYKFRN